jgi:hypothetical protein
MNTNSTLAIDVLDEFITPNLDILKTNASLKESEVLIGENKVSFVFERSAICNRCAIHNINGKYIVEFRKVTDNLLEGKIDRLVNEMEIKPEDFKDVFEQVTGIYFFGV